MLQFLETGKALYVLAAICLIGVMSRMMARRVYKRLMKETDNMALTKNRFLRDLKQKAENTYRLNQGVKNTKAYLEKQLYHCRFMGLSLNGWGNLSGQMTVLCFLTGAAAAFGAYWYRSDNYYVILYSSVGVMAGLLTMMVDYGVNLGERHQQLLAALQDYLENSLFQRLEKDIAPAFDMELDVKETFRRESRGKRENRELQEKRENVVPLAEAEKRPTRTRQEKRQEIRREKHQAVKSEEDLAVQRKPEMAVVREDVVEMRTEEVVEAVNQAAAAEPSVIPSRKDLDYLKQSLEQIAASREKNRQERDWVKNLSKDELQLVGDILREYLT